MRTNSIGKLRKDIDEISAKQALVERKLNFIGLGVIIIGGFIIINLFL